MVTMKTCHKIKRKLFNKHLTTFWKFSSFFAFIELADSFTHGRESTLTVINGVNSNELEANWHLDRLSVRTACTVT